MVAYRWQPLTSLDELSCNVDFQGFDSLHQRWLNFREQREESDPDAYRGFLERIERSWAIETGIIEGIYDLDRGTTQTLVEKGLVADLIDRSATNRDPQYLIKVLKDHQESAEFVTESIRLGTPISKHYIRQLHQLLTRNQPTYTAVDQFGNFFETELDRGGFKTQPNNPTRPDGDVHEYCPPEQVESELDNLVSLYEQIQDTGSGYHPLLVAAWLHHRFTQIHPFQDGNGRVARALLIWHLAKERYLPVVVSRDDRADYIDALEKADAGSLDPLVGFIVRLERRTILEALGEPVPVEDSGLVSQILDHIGERVRQRRKERSEQLRSVNAVAASIQETAKTYHESQAEIIGRQLGQAGLNVNCPVDWGGPGNREHWYHAQLLRTAMEANHWANLNENRYFIKLSINPNYQSQTPRLVFVVSLHHVGRQLTGIMAATAFAQIVRRQDSEQDDTEEPNDPDFRNCTVEAFTFTSEDDTEKVAPRFSAWVERSLGIALRHWSEFIS